MWSGCIVETETFVKLGPLMGDIQVTRVQA